MEKNKESESSENARLMKRLRKLNKERTRLERQNEVVVYVLEKYAEILGEPIPGDLRNAVSELANGPSGSTQQTEAPDGSYSVFDSIKNMKSCLFCPRSFETNEDMTEHVKTHLAVGSI